MFMYSYSMVIEKVTMHGGLARHACHIVPQSHGMFKPHAPRFYSAFNQAEKSCRYYLLSTSSTIFCISPDFFISVKIWFSAREKSAL